MEQFLLGFVAGEGSFQIDVNPKIDRRKYNVAVCPHFSVLVHEKEVLEKFHKELEIGQITDGYGEQFRWDVRAVDECLEIVELIESESGEYFKSTKKYEQFSGWAEAVKLMASTNKYNEQDMKKLVNISYEIGMPDKRKRNKQDFYDLIERGGGHLCGSTDTENGEPCTRNVARPENNCQWHK